jgi:hypothetical protein
MYNRILWSDLYNNSHVYFFTIRVNTNDYMDFVWDWPDDLFVPGEVLFYADDIAL